MALTRCGLLVDKAEQIARLYSHHRDWTIVEEEWLEGRHDERSTRGSSKGIYRELSSRFKTAGENLPAVTRLPTVFDQCETTRDKAQVLYFYLIEDDPLVKYITHRYVQRLKRSGTEGLNYEQETVAQLLNEFHYDDGTQFDYAESTTRRWGEGLRSVMREIGVLETQQTLQGEAPNVGTVPLLIASGYSWEQDGKEWLTHPVGWLYLFQSEPYWESLAERVGNHPGWEASGIHGELRLQPVDGTYDWAPPMEDER
ncbi:BrxA family protein [Halorubellus sp. PRR65]|uniref:BrxA family protein n=1 Tax=Halorubellus sp. PRR65 TaxID=3098148 RepID=UPI002B263D2A|nr:BrxA family protein [Halorubellus sp. PRR65]